MNQAQQIFDKHAKAGMIEYESRGFINTFPHLHSCILAAINEALSTDPKEIKALEKTIEDQDKQILSLRGEVEELTEQIERLKNQD